MLVRRSSYARCVRPSVPSTGLTFPPKVLTARGVTRPGATAASVAGSAWFCVGALWANAAVAPTTDTAAATNRTIHHRDPSSTFTLLASLAGSHHDTSP